jgi:hypothetical protein
MHWEGVEMALRETSATGPQFVDIEMPLRQLLWHRSEDRCRSRVHHPHLSGRHRVGAANDPGQPREPQEWDGIYRQRALDLPLGTIDSVDVRVDEATLAEVTVGFSDAEMLFIAGEARENRDGTLSLHRYDESLLAFTDLAAARALTWIPPRTI